MNTTIISLDRPGNASRKFPEAVITRTPLAIPSQRAIPFRRDRDQIARITGPVFRFSPRSIHVPAASIRSAINEPPARLGGSPDATEEF